MSCDLCHHSIKHDELTYIQCHKNCWELSRHPPDVQIQNLEKKIKYKHNCSSVEAFCGGNRELHEEDRNSISDAFKLRDHSNIIDDIFHYCQKFISLRTREIFHYMLNDYILERTNYKKAIYGSYYTRDFLFCNGHFGDKMNYTEFTCSDCKAVITDEFRHCCCFRLKD